MIAIVTTKGFDVVLVLHILFAAASFVALLVLRAAAASIAAGSSAAPVAARSFTGRPEVAGRVAHLVPLTGIALVALSRSALHMSTWFVATGLGLWFVAAAALEAVGFPAQRAVAAALRDNADPVLAARTLVRATELAVLAFSVAAIVMVAGTL